MSTWTRRLPVRPLMCTSQGDSGPPGHRNAWGWRSAPGGAWAKRAHAAAASGSVPPGGSQRSVSTAVPATLLRARITSAVAAGAVAGLFEPAPQPVTVSAAAITARIATVGLAAKRELEHDRRRDPSSADLQCFAARVDRPTTLQHAEVAGKHQNATGNRRSHDPPLALALAGGAVLGVANGIVRDTAYKHRVGESTANQISVATLMGHFLPGRSGHKRPPDTCPVTCI